MTAPVLQSLLLADQVYRDQMTGKHIICGVFSTIFFTPPPQPGLQIPMHPPEKAPEAFAGSGTGHGTENPLGNSGGGNGNANTGPGSPPANAPPEAGRSESHSPQQRQQPIQHLMQAGSPYVYFSVTEVRERKTFEVRYVDLTDNRTLFQTELPIECNDPLLTIEVSLPLPRLPLVGWEERMYALEVLCEGQLLGSHRVRAKITPGTVPPVTG